VLNFFISIKIERYWTALSESTEQLKLIHWVSLLWLSKWDSIFFQYSNGTNETSCNEWNTPVCSKFTRLRSYQIL